MYRIALVAFLAMILAAGCKKKTKETGPETPSGQAPSQSQSGNAGGASSGGGIMAPLQAKRSLQARLELDQLALLIEQLRDPTGRMPTKDQILAELKKTSPKLLKAIEDGAFILTGTMDGSGLWAYEADADKVAGIAVIGGRAANSTPEEVRRYLGTAIPK